MKMYKTTRRILAIAIGLSILMGQSVVPAAAQANVDKVQLSGSFPFHIEFECVGESISGTVTFKGHLRVIDTPNGGQEASILMVFSGKGQGDITGIPFNGPSTQHESFHLNANNGNIVDTFTLNFKGIRQGSADNVMVKILGHITVDANRVVTSQIDRFEIECRG